MPIICVTPSIEQFQFVRKLLADISGSSEPSDSGYTCKEYPQYTCEHCGAYDDVYIECSGIRYYQLGKKDRELFRDFYYNNMCVNNRYADYILNKCLTFMYILPKDYKSIQLLSQHKDISIIQINNVSGRRIYLEINLSFMQLLKLYIFKIQNNLYSELFNSIHDKFWIDIIECILR